MYVYLHLYVCVSACPCTAREHYICTYVEEKLGQVGLICKHEMLLPLQVRTKLAPIRGIPTKQGLQNPNQDILDIFAFWDAVPKLPQIVFGGLASCE